MYKLHIVDINQMHKRDSYESKLISVMWVTLHSIMKREPTRREYTALNCSGLITVMKDFSPVAGSYTNSGELIISLSREDNSSLIERQD